MPCHAWQNARKRTFLAGFLAPFLAGFAAALEPKSMVEGAVRETTDVGLSIAGVDNPLATDGTTNASHLQEEGKLAQRCERHRGDIGLLTRAEQRPREEGCASPEWVMCGGSRRCHNELQPGSIAEKMTGDYLAFTRHRSHFPISVVE